MNGWMTHCCSRADGWMGGWMDDTLFVLMLMDGWMDGRHIVVLVLMDGWMDDT